jgi:pimeloyl-ACP methyl ester carboxylesterase
MTSPYQAQRPSSSRFVPVRTLNYHLRCWGDESLVSPQRPPLLLMHGWMDVGASFQFVVDALAAAEGFQRFVVAPDWRGFGLTPNHAVDSYWFPDYLGDLDAIIDTLSPTAAVDLLGHSMGGNVVMSYAGVRPQRVRRLVNAEGFGMPATQPEVAPQRLAQWLDELKVPARLKPYADMAGVAARLMANDPRLSADKAAWLAPHWGRAAAGGGVELQADPAHKRVNPYRYHLDEILATWRQISAPLLWLEGEQTDAETWWGHRYSRAEFHAQRLSQVGSPVHKVLLADSGHMLHHDQPQAMARELAAFLG